MATLQSTQRPVYQPLFPDQDEVQEPREFPEELAANITPPVWKQIVGNTVTPIYYFGWRMQPGEITRKYNKTGRGLGLVDTWFQLGGEWRKKYPQYSNTAPDFILTSSGGYVVSISNNNSRETIGRIRDEEFVHAMMNFLEMPESEPGQWIRLS